MTPPASGARISDVREQEWTKHIQLAVFGAVVLVVGLLVWYFTRYIDKGAAQTGARVLGALIALSGGGLMVYALARSISVKRMPTVPYPCPYCETQNQFSATPTTTFVCEACNRTVHFENGVQVPIRIVECQFCHAEHRVAANVQKFVCDKCNRPVQLTTDVAAPTQRISPTARDLSASLPQDVISPDRPLAAPAGVLDTEGMVASTGKYLDETNIGALPPSAGAPAEAQVAGQTQDVLLLAFDRRKETETAYKLQSLLRMTLPEARKAMSEVSATAPLVVASNLAPLKAEAVRRQFQDLGATATTRPTEG